MTFQEVREDLRKMQVEPDQWVVMLEVASSMIESNGFNNLTEFVTNPWGKGGLGLTLEQAKTLAYYNPQYKHKAEKVCKKLGVIDLAKNTMAAKEKGKYQRTEETRRKTSESMKAKRHGNIDINDNISDTKPARTDQGGTSAAYRIAKLKRDHPEVATRLEAGEFKTVREAERAAGVVPPKKKLQQVWLDKDKPEEAAEKLRAKFGNDWLEQVTFYASVKKPSPEAPPAFRVIFPESMAE